MIHITLPSDERRSPSFYLAMEEYLTRHPKCDDDCFFTWQVLPSVIFGRNQVMESEVNIDYCNQHHIGMYRRKSGGGCVYADLSNVMFSYVTRSENVPLTYHTYINYVLLVLQKMGIDAKSSGRNDILIDGKKVSGTAFYHVAGHSIVHGTMLYDTDTAHLMSCLTPTEGKLRSKGVKSVRQRIALLKDYTDMTLEEFRSFAVKTLCQEERMLTPEDILAIQEMEREYLHPHFIYGNNPRHTFVRRQRVEGVGELEIHIEVKHHIIQSVNIMGDFFLMGDLDGQLLAPLRRLPFRKEDVCAALPERLDDIIMNLKKEDFIHIIFNE